MRKIILLISLLFTILLECSAKRYMEMVYSEILTKMIELSQKYPRYCKRFDVKKEYHHLIDTRCGKGLCEYWYLQITDFNLPEEKLSTLPQVLFIGGIHGDEVLGPNIVINLAEYLLQKNEESEDITRLIKSRRMILLPMANPSGFEAKRREEKQGESLFDPNRDFPYNIDDSVCLTTSCARVINYLFNKFLIQAAITFHGGTQIISYPWGAYNHLKAINEKGHVIADESPDDKAFADVADILAEEGGSNSYLNLKKYPTGKMTDTVYAVNGGMEDWAYAASWESEFSPDVISKCEKSAATTPEVAIAPSDTEYDPQTVRTMVYLIETSNSKAPSPTYLGSTDGLDGSTDKYSYGHIPINMKICITLADMLEPYIRLKEIEYSDENNSLTVQWQGGGCKTVDMTMIKWDVDDGQLSTNQSELMKGPGYYEDSSYLYKQVINLSDQDFKMNLTIKLTCDQVWGKQVEPKPIIDPQTHIVRARLNQSYYVEANGYKVSGKQVVEWKLEDITRDYLLKTRISNVKDLTLMIEFSECGTFLPVGTLTLQVNGSMNVLAIGVMGTLNIEDPFLEGHLHQYGDVSRCMDSVGSGFDLEQSKVEQDVSNTRLFALAKDEVKTVKVEDSFLIEKEEDVINLIGRSVVLEKKGHADKIFVGQIVPLQPLSCKKSNDMRGCIGTDLANQAGVCIVNMTLEETMRNFKLFIEPNPDKRTVTISGFIPNSVIDRYNKFDEIYIMNEKTEKKFYLKQKVPGYGLLEPSTFNLYPQIALGTLLKIYVQASGERLLMGDCSIGLKDAQFNETSFMMETINMQHQEKAFALRNQLLLFLVICIILILGGLVGYFIVKRYKKLKQENFEVAMTERKERYADTARMVSTARGIATARGIPQSVALASARELRDSNTARSTFSLFGSRGSRSTRRDHVELPENSEEDSG